MESINVFNSSFTFSKYSSFTLSNTSPFSLLILLNACLALCSCTLSVSSLYLSGFLPLYIRKANKLLFI